MIESIEIKNFRCFKDTKITQFGGVNLLGGLNNSGKTALLEALFLTETADAFSILFLQKQIRKASYEFNKQMPERTWDTLFFQQIKDHEIELKSIDNKLNENTITLSCDENKKELLNFSDKEEVSSNFPNKETSKSILNVKTKELGQDFSLVSSREGIVGRSDKTNLKLNKAHFITTFSSLSPSELAKTYDAVRYDNDMNEEILLDAFQIIDKTIEKIDVFSIGEPCLYLQRRNEKKMPISLFGDAINKVAEIILRIINNENSIVLIDEIENGIHFTNQEKIWEMLFNLAIEYKVQIFSTTHSLEMIKAFTSVAQKFPEDAAYFEMVRSQKTQKIKAIKHNLDTLNFELERNIGIRGDS
ncbi:MAG: AAA family ATPase [Methylococcales bacterium]|nr:AAA family ATPase [Methylococcales bacterium]